MELTSTLHASYTCHTPPHQMCPNQFGAFRFRLLSFLILPSAHLHESPWIQMGFLLCLVKDSSSDLNQILTFQLHQFQWVFFSFLFFSLYIKLQPSTPHLHEFKWGPFNAWSRVLLHQISTYNWFGSTACSGRGKWIVGCFVGKGGGIPGLFTKVNFFFCFASLSISMVSFDAGLWILEVAQFRDCWVSCV